MNLLNFLDTILDWILNWRFDLCFSVGLILAGEATSGISLEPLRWIVGGSIFIGALVVGFRWDGCK